MKKSHIIILTALLIVLISLLCNGTSYAEDKRRKRRSRLKRPRCLEFGTAGSYFPVRWKYPEGYAARTVILERRFEEEIFEFVDMETIRQEGLWE